MQHYFTACLTFYWACLTLYGRSSTRFFSKITLIFKKVLHLKDLNCHLECTDISFNPENVAFSKIKKWQTDWQTDKVTTVTLSRKRAEG